MASQVDLCNQALSTCGAEATIASMTEASREAGLCSRWFNLARDITLRAHPWGFARKVSSPGKLSQVTGDPDWLYAYAYPSDCVRVRAVQPNANVRSAMGYPKGTTLSYELETVTGPGGPIEAIRCNTDGVVIVYTYRVENPDRWDAGFELAFSLQLASMIAFDLTGDKQLAQMLKNDAAQAIITAGTMSANESNLEVQDRQAEWIEARNS